jgi:predicted kinase
MKLILFCGLPGTGKSTLAEAIGRELNIPVFAKDWLEATLVRAGLVSNNRDKSLGIAGYDLLTTLAERQFKMGQSVILDCVASTESIRTTWRNLAAQYEADWLVVECICSDVHLHEARLLERKRGIPGWYELEWADVERIRSYYAPWNELRLILDAVNKFEMNFSAAIKYLT